MLTQKSSTKSIRRSVAIPYLLAKEAESLAPEETRNFNQLVIQALSDYVEQRRAALFDADMERMAADPQVRKICAELEAEFACTIGDGLGFDP